NRRLGLRLAPLVFFEHTTVRQIESFLEQSHGAQLGAQASRANSAPASANEGSRFAPVSRPEISSAIRGATCADIAIIGVSGRYPKAGDLATFWQRLQGAESCIGEVPAERWNSDQYYTPEKGQSGKAHSKWGGFLDGIDQFDPAFFNLSPK